MNRRAFVKTSVGATAIAGVLNAPTQSQQETASAKAREYYEPLRTRSFLHSIVSELPRLAFST